MKKIYTKFGDTGMTSLPNGKKIKKTSELIELLGTLDELNSFLGFSAESLCYHQDFHKILKAVYRVQQELFEISSHLGGENKSVVSSRKINKLEKEIDVMVKALPVIRSFILPGGGECASRLHLARAVCRRAERIAFRVNEIGADASSIAIYLNRLSDWLFIAARHVAFLANVSEIEVK